MVATDVDARGRLAVLPAGAVCVPAVVRGCGLQVAAGPPAAMCSGEGQQAGRRICAVCA